MFSEDIKKFIWKGWRGESLSATLRFAVILSNSSERYNLHQLLSGFEIYTCNPTTYAMRKPKSNAESETSLLM